MTRREQLLKLLIDAYFYGVMLACSFVWLYTIGVAKANNWEVLMQFNNYGEGMIEYILMFVWLLTGVIKAVEFILEIKNGRETIKQENKMDDVYQRRKSPQRQYTL